MTIDKNIICMKWGKKFGPEYVNRLYKMVEKNMTIPHRFVCFTDDGEGIDEGIEIRPIPPLKEDGIPDRMWKKLTVFNKELSDLTGTALFLDLDIVIRQSLDPFFEIDGDFRIIKDWDFPDDIIGNSSVFRFEIGKYPEILDHFYKLGTAVRKHFQNEQAFLTYEMMERDVLQYWPEEWVPSFKRCCLQKFPMNWFKQPNEPQDAKIVIFHGKPTPEQARKGYFGKLGFRYIKATKWIDKYREN